MMKKILFFTLLIFLIGFLFYRASDVFGQGTYTCHWSQLTYLCIPVPNCTQGYRDGGECYKFKNDPDCTNAGPFTCVEVPQPPPPPGGCEDGEIEIQTAIGPINVCSPQDFVASILKLAIGIGGGIAMLLIIFGGIQILTSAGNPEKIQAGKELITSAIAGLILIVFSVFILRIIGVEILDIF